MEATTTTSLNAESDEPPDSSRKSTNYGAAFSFLSNIQLGNEIQIVPHAVSEKHDSRKSSLPKQEAMNFLTSIPLGNNVIHEEPLQEVPTVELDEGDDLNRHSSLDSSSSMSVHKSVTDSNSKDNQYMFVKHIRELSGVAQGIERPSIIYASVEGTPLSVTSILDYDTSREKLRRRTKSINQGKFEAKKLEGTKRARTDSYVGLLSEEMALIPYDPSHLDDGELTKGINRSIIPLPSYIASLIPYARPSDLKKELNEVFKLKHPEVDPSLTLSQIRKLKTRMIGVASEGNFEVCSVAQAFAYLEKLILKLLVNKTNRRLMGAVCLLLAIKVNEKPSSYARVMQIIAKHLDVTTKEIRDQEFFVFTQLGFQLHIPQDEFIPHFEKIFNHLDFSNIQEYLGTKMYQAWLSVFGSNE